MCCIFFFQAEDGIRDVAVTGVQTCALPISESRDGPGECPRGIGDVAPREHLVEVLMGIDEPWDDEPPRQVQCLHSARYGRGRSEERRVGKECRSRWSPYH